MAIFPDSSSKWFLLKTLQPTKLHLTKQEVASLLYTKKIEKDGGCQNFPMLFEQKKYFFLAFRRILISRALLNCNQNYLFWLLPRMIDFSSKLSPPQSWIFHRICWNCWRWLEWEEKYREHHRWRKLEEKWAD